MSTVGCMQNVEKSSHLTDMSGHEKHVMSAQNLMVQFFCLRKKAVLLMTHYHKPLTSLTNNFDQFSLIQIMRSPRVIIA